MKKQSVTFYNSECSTKFKDELSESLKKSDSINEQDKIKEIFNKNDVKNSFNSNNNLQI